MLEGIIEDLETAKPGQLTVVAVAKAFATLLYEQNKILLGLSNKLGGSMTQADFSAQFEAFAAELRRDIKKEVEQMIATAKAAKR